MTAPQDWKYWADTLGFREFLLPTVAVDGLALNPKSSIRSYIKLPSRVLDDDTVVGIPAWQVRSSTQRDIDRWSSDGRLGICISGRALRGLDIDLPDVSRGAAVREFVYAWLSERGLPVPDVRWREGVGKCLLPFKVEAPAMAKRILKTAHGNIEWLADKQQWLIQRGDTYRWSDSDGCPLGNPTTFGELTLEQFEVLWAALKEQFEAEDLRENDAGMVPTKPRTLADASAANDDLAAWMVENGWSTEWEADGKLRIRCPFGDGHSGGQEGDGSTVYFPAGTGGFERGHFRCLHASCAGRKDGDYITRLGYLNDDFEVIEAPAAALDEDGMPKLRPAGLTVNNRTGLLEPTLANIDLCLAHPKWSGVEVGFDEFEHKRILRWAGGGWQPFTDASYTDIRLHLVRAGNMAQPSEADVKSVCLRAEREGRFDSAQDWLKKLRWDGVPRMDTFARDYLGCADTPYTRAVGRYMLSAMAGRVASPGCKADMVPVMVSPQGWQKSGALRALAMTPEAFLELAFDPHQEDDNKRKLAGKLMVELAEMKGLTKRDNDTLKEFITRQYEEWVPKYMENTRRFPRRSIMVGTSNRQQWLPYDPSGYRRWLPLALERGCSAAMVQRNAEQLWAEAYASWLCDGIDWQDAEHLAKQGNVWAPFVIGDHRDGRVVEWLAERSEFDADGVATANGDGVLTVAQVISGALGVPLGRQSHADAHLVCRVLRDLGFVESRQQHQGARQRVWGKP